MRLILNIYSILFLSFGNILLSNIHYLHDHSDHEDNEVECYECINIDTNNNFISNINEIKIQPITTSKFLYPYFSVIKSINAKIYFSRAPPAS